MYITMGLWRPFSTPPNIDDTNAKGCIETRMRDGSCRTALWNWVTNAALWNINGFYEWRPMKSSDNTEPATVFSDA